MTPLDYDFLRKSLKERSGLVLSADKQYLAESRLLPVACKAGLGTLSELVAVLKRGNAEALMTAVVEAMMTNESVFFRDKVPFEHFRSTILPALKAARRTSRTIRIWCAAAATGQEPYSLAICLKENSPLIGLANLIATPHIAGSTAEAQEEVGTAVAQQVRDYLADGLIRNAVNMPALSPERSRRLRPYIDLGERLGALIAQAAPSPSFSRIRISVCGGGGGAGVARGAQRGAKRDFELRAGGEGEFG